LLLWAIWPPGDYRFDNIRLYEIPDTAESGSTNAPPVR
jgi:hypothetical protein